jgi:hypothetical protein
MVGGSKYERQLEYHKIPEYYDQYIDYRVLKGHIKQILRRRLSKSHPLTIVIRIRGLEQQQPGQDRLGVRTGVAVDP